MPSMEEPSRGSYGERVWMPKGLSARARLELAAIFTVLLVSPTTPYDEMVGPDK